MSLSDSVFLRALAHPRDYWRVVTHQVLVLKDRIQETESVYTLRFSLTRPLTWQAGQHGVFVLPRSLVTEGQRWRVFSIASVPAEQVIQIGTHIPTTPSTYKVALKTLLIGQSIMMYGPLGEFHCHSRTTHIVGIASGIGITPFRSLLLDVTARNPEIRFDLIYATRESRPVYYDDLQAITQVGTRTIHYCTDAVGTRTAVEQAVAKYGSNATYYISGSPRFIASMRAQLITHGIHTIITDPFKGY